VSLNENALKYHAAGRPGKVKVVPTTPCATADDLSLAYSPGVAAPCLAIEKEPEDAYKYTAKGNLVAVLSNGSAVLGLGNIGALAGKPVMEGKGVLFKRFADIDVFDIEVDSQDTAEIIRFCEMIAPTFGGINLEDIRAPECFEIEEKLKESLDIPVFHDDQHGTAIISAAALLNGLEIQDKKIDEVKVVFSGAGAAAISCAKLYKDIGVKAENIIMCDSRGVMWDGRGEGYNKYKDEFVAKTDARTLEDAMVGCDVFVGLSQKGLVSQDMVKSMADRPMIFAMANPDPEITPIDAKAARSDAICATGRSDYANQVNNVLGFPFIFRGALDVRASKINEEMKQAATYALAELAKRDEPVPDAVKNAYPGESFDFGPEYIIPKPFDSRVLLYVAPAVAKAAMESGVARSPIDLDDYQVKLNQMLEEVRSL
jgi:malate dehydrogenase (oxaloacetate-decarboxylating)(NADP+)